MILSAILFLHMQVLPDAPRPQLKLRPANDIIVVSDKDDMKREHVWMKRGLKFGSIYLAAKIVDDSTDNPTVLGPKKAALVGLSVGATVCLIEKCWK